MSFSIINGPSGSPLGDRNSKITKNKPKKSTIALFQALQHGSLRKYILNEIMATVNGRTLANSNGYCTSTISWHITNKRIHRSHYKGKTFLMLTDKGFDYANARGIF